MMSNTMNMGIMSNSMNMNSMSYSMDMGMMSMMNGDKDPIMIMAKWMPNMKTIYGLRKLF